MTETLRVPPIARDAAPAVAATRAPVVSAPAVSATLTAVTATAWALVRECLLAPPPPAATACTYAALTERLHAAVAEQDRLRPGLEDALYRLIASAETTQRAILLPLRRSIHNGRPPAPAQAQAARTIAQALPELGSWLDLASEIASAVEDLATHRAAALAERRADLARLASTESVARAAIAISPDLHDALVRYAASCGHPDRRSAKSEAMVLRHILRATTKTVPLSWFVAVGWSPRADAGSPGSVRAATRPELTLVQRLLDQALLGLPIDDRPLNIVPGSHFETATERFVVPRPGSEAGRSERLSLPVTPLLREVVTRVGSAWQRDGRPLTAADLARDLAGVDPAALRRFIARLVELGALDHTAGIEPSDLPAATAWLAAIGARPQAEVLATALAETATYAATPAAGRGAARTRLRAAWASVQPGDHLLTEDVVSAGAHPAPIPRERLIALAPLAEVFDAFPLLRRVQRHRFVATFGRGGTCPSLAEYARCYDAAWSDPTAFDDLAVRGDVVASGVLQARADIDRLADRWIAPNGMVDTWIGDSVLDLVARSLPQQVRSRPSSHAWFVQRDGAGGLAVNQVYGGWGRFASRFLPELSATAATAVRESIVRGLGPHARPAQIRPLGGFAANVHPLVLDTEIVPSGRAGRVGDVRLDDIEVVHDLAGDDIRFRARGSTAWLDVIYHGFLVPMLLPAHLRAIVNDLGSGLVDFGNLSRTVTLATPIGDLAATGRVQCGTTVLGRRHWLLSADQVAGLQRLLADDATRAVELARMCHAAGWPRRLFVGSAPSALGEALPATAAFTTRMTSQRSQYVDLADPLHLHVLRKTLARYATGMRVEEAWPIPAAGEPTREYVVETYRRAGPVAR